MSIMAAKITFYKKVSAVADIMKELSVAAFMSGKPDSVWSV